MISPKLYNISVDFVIPQGRENWSEMGICICACDCKCAINSCIIAPQLQLMCNGQMLDLVYANFFEIL